MRGNGNKLDVPDNAEAERALLCCLFELPEAFDRPEVSAVQPSDFLDQQFGTIYRHLRDTHAAGNEPSAILARMVASGELDQTMRQTLFEVMHSGVSGSDADYFASLVREEAERRSLWQLRHALERQIDDRLPTADVRGFLAGYLQSSDGINRQQRFEMLTPAELAKISHDVPYLVPNVLPESQPGAWVGGSKMLKTSTACDLTLAGAVNGSWLGYFKTARKFRSWFLSGESGSATIAETYRRIARRAGYDDLAKIDGFNYGSTLPQLNSAADVAELGRRVRGGAIELLLLDPLMLCADFGGREGSVFAFGPMGRRVADEICGKSKCALIIVHHATQAKAKAKDYSPPTLNDASWAGIEQFSRFWILYNRRETYRDGTGQHRLWLALGGSAGHGGLFHLDIDEGTRQTPGGRFWRTSLTPANEAMAQEAERKAAAAADRDQRLRHEHQQRIIDALRVAPDTRRGLRTSTRLNDANFSEAMQALLLAGKAEPCEVKKHTSFHDGYRLKDGW